MPRSSRLAVALAILALGACRRDDDAHKPLVIDSAGGGVIDRDPSTTATTIGHLLSDANVFAVLDTNYAVIIATDKLAQANASDPRVKELAGRSFSQNSLARSGIKSTADRLNIAPALPDEKVIKGRLEDYADLQQKTGADFDKAYLDHVSHSRHVLIDDIDDALKGKSITQQPVRQFLAEVKTNLVHDRETAKTLRDSLK